MVLAGVPYVLGILFIFIMVQVPGRNLERAWFGTTHFSTKTGGIQGKQLYHYTNDNHYAGFFGLPFLLVSLRSW